MIVAGIDIETTGLDFAKGDRITEIGIALYRDGKRIGGIVKRVNPEREVSAKAAQITGLTLDALKDEPKWAEVGPLIHQVLEKADLVIGHNSDSFDLPFVQHEQKQIGIDWVPKSGIDTMRAARWATPNGKLPSLKELSWSLGLKYDQNQAHTALYDADLCAQCYLEGVNRGYFAS